MMSNESNKHLQHPARTIDPKKRDSEEDINQETYDKTIEDSFPASDPPSSIPDPDDKEDEHAA
jgi:hypothetical protein